jgi:hypothetical protein
MKDNNVDLNNICNKVKHRKRHTSTIACIHEGMNFIVKAKQRLNRDGSPTVVIVVNKISKKDNDHNRLVTIKCPSRSVRDLGCALQATKNCLGDLGFDCLPCLVTAAEIEILRDCYMDDDVDRSNIIYKWWMENLDHADKTYELFMEMLDAAMAHPDWADDGESMICSEPSSPQNTVRKLLEWYRARKINNECKA